MEKVGLNLDDRAGTAFENIARGLPSIADGLEGAAKSARALAADLTVEGSEGGSSEASIDEMLDDLDLVSVSSLDSELTGRLQKVAEDLAPYARRPRETVDVPQDVYDSVAKGMKLATEHARAIPASTLTLAKALATQDSVSKHAVDLVRSALAKIDHDEPGFGDDRNPCGEYVEWLLLGSSAGEAWVGKSDPVSTEKRYDVQPTSDGQFAVIDVEEGEAIGVWPDRAQAEAIAAERNAADESEHEEKAEKRFEVRIIKQDSEEERTVFGEVLVPEDIDAQNDVYSVDEVRKTAWRFMEDYQQFGLMHKQMVDTVKVLESYLAPVDFEVDVDGEKQLVKKGTWLLRSRVLDDAIWKAVKSKELTGYSIGGSAIKKPEEAVA